MPTISRSFAVRYAPLAAAVAVAVGAELTTNALADVFRIKPTFGLEQVFTDNVRGSSSDHDADGVTILTARFEATLRTAQVNAAAAGEAYYNEFWASNDLDSVNANGIAAARVEVLRNFFFVDLLADRREVLLSPQNVSASGITTGQNVIQQTGYDVSPFMTFEVFGLADAVVRGRYARVQFDEPVVGVAATLLSDITIKQAAGRITTGERSSMYELVGTGEYIEADTGFEDRNILGSVILKPTKSIHLIGRIGYERIFDPSFPLIHGTIWSAGGRVAMGQNSFVHVEYGRRFNDNSWLGEMNLALTPFISLDGAYTDTLSPIQFTLTRTLEELLDQDGDFNLSVPPGPNLPNPLLIDQIVRDKNARMTATFTRGAESYALSVGHFDREFPALLDKQQFYAVSVAMTEQLSRSMQYFLNLQYEDNYDVLATGVPTQAYRTNFEVIYKFSDDYILAGRYTWQLDTSPGDIDTYQNVLRFSVSRSL